MGLLTNLGALVRESLAGMADFWGSLPPGHIVVVGKDYFLKFGFNKTKCKLGRMLVPPFAPHIWLSGNTL